MDNNLELLEELERKLSLKQLQIRSLQTITQAINENIAADQLFGMYRSFLSWEMGINKMALYTNTDGQWECVSKINDEDELKLEHPEIYFSKYKRLHTITDSDPLQLRYFDVIIPVFHKDIPLAYAFLGDIKEKEDIYNKVQFIISITNIIAVAIENKRLFKKQIEQERLNREMRLAMEVQQMLIPDSLPDNGRYELGSIYKPHLNVGGDYIDFFRFSEDKFAFCIADISGKGVAAAMLMANFQAIIQSLVYQYRDLETFIFALNEIVHQRITKSDKYITFFICEVDVVKKQLRYINAGHYPPLLCTQNQIIRLSKGCTVIGAFEKLPEIREEMIKLTGESLILTFTDGLTELKNTTGDFFDDDKITAFICDNKDLSVSEFNQNLLNEINKFKQTEDYTDDIAILTCKIK
ncbi:MAG: PP2C family protein-serine/threonine phosphatase [Deltaproteobacteria bacterium]